MSKLIRTVGAPNKRPHLTADGEWRFEVEYSALRRHRDWDYRRPGSYQITLVMTDRSRGWLGWLVETSEQAHTHGGGMGGGGMHGGGMGGGGTHGGVGGGGMGGGGMHGGGMGGGGMHGGGMGGGQAGERRWGIALSPLGEGVARLWRELGAMWPGVEPRECQVMPEHFHGILRITTMQKHPLGQIIGSFKAKATAMARELGAKGEAVPAAVMAGEGLFAPGLNDLILWDLARYRHARDYLLANPERLAAKRANPELFRVVSDLAVALPGLASEQAHTHGGGTHGGGMHGGGMGGGTHGGGMHGGGMGGSGTHGGVGGSGTHGGVMGGSGTHGGVMGGATELAQPPVGHFMALGNRFLLAKPLFQVQCSRRDFAYKRVKKPKGEGLEIARDANGEPIVEHFTREYEARREAAFAAAQDGMVLISPCVSDGERQIAHEAFKARLNLITLKNKGFSPLQKPSGAYFDACTAGRLLMLAPAAWPYTPGHKEMTRLDATAMNRLCQWIVGENAAVINYHGMRPDNIDALAMAAICRARDAN